MAENTCIKGKNNRVVSIPYKKELDSFLDDMKRRNYSIETLKSYQVPLCGNFFFFLAASGITQLREVTPALLDKYRLSLVEGNFSPRTIELYLRAVKRFFRYLENEGYLFIDPAAKLRNPKPPRKFGFVPTRAEITKLLGVCDMTRHTGIRDRAMLETAYSTGVRRAELLSLTVFSPDLKNGILRVFGKGRKERTVPLGKHAVLWLDRYLTSARSELAKNNIDENALWINKLGRKVSKEGLQMILRSRSEQAGFSRIISIHSIRRACATHMLSNGAHPVQIQMLLGHSTLDTLSQYLSVSITELRKTHAGSKPGK